jgi:hypothetical protein
MAGRKLIKHTSTVASTVLLYFVLGIGLHILEGAIHQPHTKYETGNWFSHRIPGSMEIGLSLAVGILVCILIDLSVRRAIIQDPYRDLAYYPQLRGIWRCLFVARARLTLLIGLLALGAYCTKVELEVYPVSLGAGGLVWPPQAVLFGSLSVWGLLWLADCLAAPTGRYHSRCCVLSGFQSFVLSGLFRWYAARVRFLGGDLGK